MQKFMKAIAAIMLMVLVAFAMGCTPEEGPDNGGDNNGGGDNGGGNNGGNTELLDETGMYLGIIGFNTTLHTMPITRLDNSSFNGFKTFIDNLEMDDATLLIEAVNTSLDNLTSSGIPRNLINVSIINFTDGMDEGSWNYSNHHHGTNYTDGTQYLDAVSNRIQTEKISNLPIEAHTIAFKGNDVYDESLFGTTIEKISSTPSSEYVHFVNDFSEVQTYFKSIAENLVQTSTNSILTMRFPVPNPNSRIRFTFDEVDDVSQSQQYIEGVFVMGSDGNGVLTNVQYVGLKSSSGSTVAASTTGDIKVEFKFEGMKDADDSNFTTSNISNVKKWMLVGDSWVHNSEWHSSGNTEVTNEYFSSLIILNVDCSLSLGDAAFGQLKNAAKEFVKKLKTT